MAPYQGQSAPGPSTRDWQSQFYELPRKHILTWDDFKLGKRFPQFDKVRRLNRMVTLAEGPKSKSQKAARDALQDLLELFVALMRYDGAFENDFITAKADNVQSTPPDYNYTLVRKNWYGLVQILVFTDWDQVGKNDPPHIRKQRLETLKQDPRRQGALEFLNRFIKERAKGNVDDAVREAKPLDDYTLRDVYTMSEKETGEKARELGLERRNESIEDTQNRIAQTLGLLDKDTSLPGELPEPEEPLLTKAGDPGGT